MKHSLRFSIGSAASSAPDDLELSSRPPNVWAIFGGVRSPGAVGFAAVGLHERIRRSMKWWVGRCRRPAAQRRHEIALGLLLAGLVGVAPAVHGDDHNECPDGSVPVIIRHGAVVNSVICVEVPRGGGGGGGGDDGGVIGPPAHVRKADNMLSCIRSRIPASDNTKSSPHRFDWKDGASPTAGYDPGTGEYVTTLDPGHVRRASKSRLHEIIVHELTHHVIYKPDSDTGKGHGGGFWDKYYALDSASRRCAR